jgi:hypothetical protein
VSIESQGVMAACYGSMLTVWCRSLVVSRTFFFPSASVRKISAFPPSRPLALLASSAAAGTSAAVAARGDPAKKAACNGTAGSQEGRRVRSDVDKKHSSMQPQPSQPKLAIEEEQRTILVYKK